MKKQRNYILCSRVCSVEEYNRIIIDDKFKTSQSIQKYYRVLCDGFSRNNLHIIAFSVRPTNKQMTGGVYLPAKDERVGGVDYHYTRSINIRFIDRLYAFLASFFWFLSPRNCDREDVVIFDPLCLMQGLGCFLACRIRSIRNVAYVTDLPNVYASPERMSRLFKRLSSWIQTRADGDIFVTEQMNIASNPKHKPYIVIEGFVDQAMEQIPNLLECKHKAKVVLYSGGLRSQYGLDMLVKGFIRANIPTSELHIYGDGDYANEIRQFAENDARIKFWGIRENAVVVEEQMKAILLVNPRYTDADYTKYSFPGKNLEYMVSGTATLTTVLPGMPYDYYPYVYLLKNESEEGMAKILVDILSRPIGEIHAFGQSAKEWILSNKNNKKQVARIVAFLDNMR